MFDIKRFISKLVVIVVVVFAIMTPWYYLEKWIYNLEFLSRCLGIIFPSYALFYIYQSWKSDLESDKERIKGFEKYQRPKFSDEKPVDLLINLYSNVSADTRTLWQVTWQIPPFAVTTSSVVILAGIGYIKNPLISGIFLVLGSFLDYVLFIELRKHNFGLKVRQRFLDEIMEYLKLPTLPKDVNEELNYLEDVSVKWTEQVTRLPYRRPANLGLETSVFLLALVILSMGVYELLIFKPI